MNRITSVNPATGNISYRQVKITVPRCRQCARRWFGTANPNDHPEVQQSLRDGWKIGEEPSESDAFDFMRKFGRY